MGLSGPGHTQGPPRPWGWVAGAGGPWAGSLASLGLSFMPTHHRAPSPPLSRLPGPVLGRNPSCCGARRGRALRSHGLPGPMPSPDPSTILRAGERPAKEASGDSRSLLCPLSGATQGWAADPKAPGLGATLEPVNAHGAQVKPPETTTKCEASHDVVEPQATFTAPFPGACRPRSPPGRSRPVEWAFPGPEALHRCKPARAAWEHDPSIQGATGRLGG